MQSFTRLNALFAPNFFKSVNYHPDESQLLTCGTDRKLTYWDVTDMNAIRIVDGSEVPNPKPNPNPNPNPKPKPSSGFCRDS